MYSPRQRDLRERRHQHIDDLHPADEATTADPEESVEFDAPSGWGIQLSTRGSAA